MNADDVKDDFHEFVVLTHARNLPEAEFFQGLLEARDIPALIEGEATEVIGLPGSVFSGGVPILVPDELLDEARAVLADHAGATETSGGHDEDDPPEE